MTKATTPVLINHDGDMLFWCRSQEIEYKQIREPIMGDNGEILAWVPTHWEITIPELHPVCNPRWERNLIIRTPTSTFEGVKLQHGDVFHSNMRYVEDNDFAKTEARYPSYLKSAPDTSIDLMDSIRAASGG